jgi:hypothetical protein
VRLIEPSLIPCTTSGGSTSASTLSPTDNAVVGSTAVPTTPCTIPGGRAKGGGERAVELDAALWLCLLESAGLR